MANKHFEIHSDHEADMVRIVVEGFWQPDDFVDFFKAISAEEAHFTSKSKTFRAMCDARTFTVQGGDVVQLFSGFFERPGIPISRAALIISSTLLKLQVMRVIGDQRYRFFDDIHEAEAWIADPN
jgi:hypothetical protein